jgi:hypothetical protein
MKIAIRSFKETNYVKPKFSPFGGARGGFKK